MPGTQPAPTVYPERDTEPSQAVTVAPLTMASAANGRVEVSRMEVEESQQPPVSAARRASIEETEDADVDNDDDVNQKNIPRILS